MITEMYEKSNVLERSATARTGSDTSFRTMKKVVSNNRSRAWLIIRVIQIIVCVVVLILSVFLVFASLNSNHTWFNYHGDGKLVVEGSFERTDLGIFFSVFIILAVATLSLLSSLISLITYCCHRLSIKLIIFWDFLMAIGWLVCSVFTGVFISDQMGWSVDYWVMDLYKLNLVLSIITILLFIASAGLGIRLHQHSKRRASSMYNTIRTPSPPYTAKQEEYYAGTLGKSYKSYSNHITPPPPNYRPSGEWEAVILDGKNDLRKN